MPEKIKDRTQGNVRQTVLDLLSWDHKYSLDYQCQNNQHNDCRHLWENQMFDGAKWYYLVVSNIQSLHCNYDD